jgi:photosystem II stability/assembly factor-like uncharacterized protein
MHLYSVAFATPQSGWTVGDSGTILHTEDGGATWKDQISATQDYRLHSVAFVTPQLGWSVGDHGTIMRTEDAGAHWKLQNSGRIEVLMSIAFAM